MSISKRFGAWLACGLALTTTQTAMAGVAQNAGYDPFHIEWGSERQYEGVGLVTGITGDNQTYVGSGTLIKKSWVLTAAHVVDIANQLVFQVDGETYFAKQWYVPTKWTHNNAALGLNNDIALIQLSEPVRGVKLTKWHTRKRIARGQDVVSVGYGNSGVGATGQVNGTAGIDKRAGRNMVDVTDSSSRELIYDFDAMPNNPNYLPSLDVLYEIEEFEDFDSITGGQSWEREDLPIGREYMIAQGDSGGPVILDGKIAGIHSWGQGWVGRFSGFGSVSGSTDVAFWNSWIKEVLRERARADKTVTGRFGDIIGGAEDDDETVLHNFLYERALEVGAPVEARRLLNFIVPEPTTVTLLGMTGALVVLRRTRR